jgi:hypothetical protein
LPFFSTLTTFFFFTFLFFGGPMPAGRHGGSSADVAGRRRGVALCRRPAMGERWGGERRTIHVWL